MADLDIHLLILIAALILDACIGDPPWLWSHLPHPTALMGKFIKHLDNALNSERWTFSARLITGAISLAIVIVFSGAAGYALTYSFDALQYGYAFEALAASIMLAQKSLYTHVKDVASALQTNGLEGGRKAISHIVGRDPETLDESAVSRAAIETLAENFSDGVVAPCFYYILGGLPGLFIYKAVNTADSMIGYKTKRHRAFGWASARTDDLLNIIPARLSACFIACAAAISARTGTKSLKVIWRDAGKHASPNAGWPEAAMAGALDLALAGPRHYGGNLTDDPWINEKGKKTATVTDIRASLKIYILACLCQLALIATLVLLFF